MPMTTTERYQDWKAPSEDGSVLIWPTGKGILEEARENQKRLSQCDARVGGVSVKELRQRMRGWLGHRENDKPIVASGHQAELYHPGVWIKNAVIEMAARALDGEAMQFSVDTDEPKHLTLKWPPGKEVVITDDPNLATAAWSGLVAGPTPGHLKVLEEKVEQLNRTWGFQSGMPAFLQSMRRLTLEERSLPGALVDAMHELDWNLGLKYQTFLASPMWSAEPYLVFVHHLMSRAGQFAGQYNEALRDFRLQQGIRSPGRPMPDLKTSEQAVEAPFWIDDLAKGTRQRAWLRREGDEFVVGEDFSFGSENGEEGARNLGMWLRRKGWRISPRALTLTMFLRLFVADQWVHGIGGARYDQVLDRLIHTHFGIEPPAFSVATATLYFPGATGKQRACLPCLKQQLHGARHAVLGEEKAKFVEEIEALPRDSMQRRTVFSEMHRRLHEAGEHDARLRHAEQAFTDAENRRWEEDVLFSRELFYALQTRQRLEELADKCR